MLLLSNDDDLADPVSLTFHLITSSLILHILAVTTSTRSMAMSLPTMNFRDVKRREMGILEDPCVPVQSSILYTTTIYGKCAHLRIIGVVPEMNFSVFFGEYDWRQRDDCK